MSQRILYTETGRPVVINEGGGCGGCLGYAAAFFIVCWIVGAIAG